MFNGTPEYREVLSEGGKEREQIFVNQ